MKPQKSLKETIKEALKFFAFSAFVSATMFLLLMIVAYVF